MFLSAGEVLSVLLQHKIELILFSKSIRGADASATIYSITETALLNGLKPYLYLTYVLDQLRRMGSFPEEEKLDQLLPWSKKLPEELRTTE